MSARSTMVRMMFTRSDNERDKDFVTPEDVARYDDIVYGTDPAWQSLDVYRPREAEGKLPVIVSVHGGGWVYGDKERYQFYCMDLARRGFAVVNYTYHLAPESKYPQQMRDTCLVFQWVLDHADAYGLDEKNIFAVGDSAGGHLLSLFCAGCVNPVYAALYDFPFPEEACPRAVGLNCGAYVLKTGKGGNLTGGLMKDLLPGRGTPEEMRMLRPLPHITSAFPPAFVMTAVKDFLQEDALQMKARLEEMGVACVYRLYDNADHSLAHVFHVNIRLEEAGQCNDDECSFFREHMI